MIIGRQLAKLADVEHADLTERRVGVSVDGLSGSIVRDVSFQMHDGEVVGLTGLIGSGFEEVAVPALRGALGARRAGSCSTARRSDLTRLTPHRGDDGRASR